MIFSTLYLVIRVVVVAALLYACIVALTAWTVRARHLNPFGPWPRFVRRISDPLLRVVERRIVQVGGSPADAPLWLIGIVVVAGLLLVTLTRWLFGAVAQVEYLADAGPREWAAVILGLTFRVLMAALLIRVIASWFGVSRYRTWMRPVFVLTDWLVEPIRRVLPPVGMIDFSPIVAWLVLWVLRGFLLGLL